MDDASAESEGHEGILGQVVCPHCGKLASLSETPQLKRLKRSVAPPPLELSDWEILGIAKGSSRQQIQSAYRRKALGLHPDKPQGDRAAFERLTEAHDRLISFERLRSFCGECGDHKITHDHQVRAQVVMRIMTDVKKGSWQERLRQEESATLAALKALLEDRAPTVAKGTIQPICDDRAEMPQRVTIKGIITEVRRQRPCYRVRMASNGLVIQSESTWSLEEALNLRSAIVFMKEASGGRNASKEDAWQIFADAPAVFWYSMEAGSKFRNTTASTMDLDTCISYGRALRSAAAEGKPAMLSEQKRQKMELKAIRLSTKNAEDELLEVVNALLLPRAVRRRLRGKQPPPQNAYGLLALPPPQAAPDAQQVPVERSTASSRKSVGWFWRMMPWSRRNDL